MGLDLLCLVEGTERVVFVDAVCGLGLTGKVVVYPTQSLRTRVSSPKHFDHAAGLDYLLQILPNVCEGPVPEALLVGLEGMADDQTIASAAQICIKVAKHGLPVRA